MDNLYPVQETKRFYKSKTVWWNVLTFGVEVVQVLGDVGVIPPGAILIVNAVGNVVLRFLTTKPITIA